jgi:hypothetical protein
MAEDHDAEEPDVQPELPERVRRTAPQSEYELRDVWTGLAVLAVALLLTFGLALAF